MYKRQELALRAQGLEETVQRLEAAAKAVAERTALERSAQVHPHSLHVPGSKITVDV